MCSGSLLFVQCPHESFLSLGDEILIASRIDKDTGTILWIVLQLREHMEVPTVGAEKYVAGQT